MTRWQLKEQRLNCWQANIKKYKEKEGEDYANKDKMNKENNVQDI